MSLTVAKRLSGIRLRIFSWTRSGTDSSMSVFTTPGATDPYQSPTDGRRETEMVTGDLNAALVEWVVQYRISEPRQFLFEVREPSATLRYVSESVMREVVGDRTVDEVITVGRQEIESEALLKMQARATKYAMGISIDQVQLKNINPPQPVQASFNEVNQAQQEKERIINEARRAYNRVIPLAEGEKDQRIREADGYRLRRINEAEGDAARFTALLTEYRQAPEVTRRRIYIETLQDVLPGIGSKIIVDGSTATRTVALTAVPSATRGCASAREARPARTRRRRTRNTTPRATAASRGTEGCRDDAVRPREPAL